MRRFISSLPGKIVSHVVALALMLPSFTLLAASRAQAQIQSLPSIAVVEFDDLKASGGEGYGSAAAEAIAVELGKLAKYEVVSPEEVRRGVATLGLQTPVKDENSLFRLGQEVRAASLVTGELVNYRVQKVGNGKQADVILRVVVRDMASGLPVNGSAVSASSTVRTGDVADAVVVAEALSAGAARVVRDIDSRSLPSATVLNTLENQALINAGARSGFSSGMNVVVIRGREQVATAKLSNVEPDQATIRVERSTKGIQPGDKVRAVFAVPAVNPSFSRDGSVQVERPKRQGNNSGIVSTLLILGLVAILVGGVGGGSGSSGSANQSPRSVTAEPLVDAAGRPAVRIKWSTDAFGKGNYNRVAWQIWRSEVLDSPVLVVPGTSTSATDNSLPRTVNYADFGRVGGITCDFTSGTTDTAEAVPGVTPGRSLRYQVELVYKVNSIDLPGSTAGSGGTGGTTTGGTTTGGTTTGGTTTGGGTGGTTTGGTTTGGGTGGTTTGGTTTGGTGSGEDCYFVSGRATSSGYATPIIRPALVSPANNATVAAPSGSGAQLVNGRITFTFQSSVTLDTLLAEYIVQVSNSPSFPKSATKTVGQPLISSSAGQLSITTDNDFYTAANSVVWWRVGAKIRDDRPGPLPDPATGLRYVFSGPNRFTRPSSPPPPPAP